MTWLAEDPELWDTVFPENPERLRFLRNLCARIGKRPRVLDIGCATGTLCRLLSAAGCDVVGVDVNPTFIGAARARDPQGTYRVGDMRTFSVRGARFDVVLCLGTTFSYNATNDDALATARRMRQHLAPGGTLIVDVLNAIAFTGPRPFRPVTKHAFTVRGEPATATILHRLQLGAQTMTEQVSWRIGARARRDEAETLRLFFPQEIAFLLAQAGLTVERLRSSFGREPAGFSGRRLIAISRFRPRASES